MYIFFKNKAITYTFTCLLYVFSISNPFNVIVRVHYFGTIKSSSLMARNDPTLACNNKIYNINLQANTPCRTNNFSNINFNSYNLLYYNVNFIRQLFLLFLRSLVLLRSNF